MSEGLAAMLLQTLGVPFEDANSGNSTKKEERVPPWGCQETMDFISLRAEFEKDSDQANDNNTLWEAISEKMKESGYRRTAEQCKSKWKSLVNRYKEKETSEIDNGRKCPSFEELQTISTERARDMNMRLPVESETGGRKKSRDSDKKNDCLGKKRKRKAEQEGQKATAERSRANSMQEVLEGFFQQQQRLEVQWREAFERREQERRVRERDWRAAMEKLEKYRMMREQAWRESEEQRRAREELRAEKRDALFTALLTRLAREEL